MTDFYHLSNLGDVPAALRGAYVAIGNFDGFHRGHQTVIATLKDRAAAARHIVMRLSQMSVTPLFS